MIKWVFNSDYRKNESIPRCIKLIQLAVNKITSKNASQSARGSLAIKVQQRYANKNAHEKRSKIFAITRKAHAFRVCFAENGRNYSQKTRKQTLNIDESEQGSRIIQQELVLWAIDALITDISIENRSHAFRVRSRVPCQRIATHIESSFPLPRGRALGNHLTMFI